MPFAQGASLLNIMLTDAFWRMSAAGNQFALHAGVGPHNACFCLLMVGLLLYSVASDVRHTHTGEHALLSDDGFTAACAAAVISLLATIAACFQLVGWLATFGACLVV